jgi:hypothetical protein
MHIRRLFKSHNENFYAYFTTTSVNLYSSNGEYGCGKLKSLGLIKVELGGGGIKVPFLFAKMFTNTLLFFLVL